MRDDPLEAIEVSEADVELWLNTVPKHLSKLPSRRARYRKYWNVDYKIRREKQAGNWPPKADGF